MTIVGWVLFILGIIAVLTGGVVVVQDARGVWTDHDGDHGGTWGDKGFKTTKSGGLVLLIGLILILVSQTFGKADHSPGASPRAVDPVTASAPTPATVTVTATESPRMSPTTGSADSAPSTSQPSTPEPSRAAQSATTSSSSASKSGPWSGSTDGLQLVVERIYGDPGHSKLKALALRVVNSSGRGVDFGLDNFLAIDNHGNHYNADEDLSDWDANYVEDGQRVPGVIVLSTALRPGTTALQISFNVSSDNLTYETVQTTVPIL